MEKRVDGSGEERDSQVVTVQGLSLFTRHASQSHDDSMNGCVLSKVAHKPNRERRL